jgi:hypothetical protein
LSDTSAWNGEGFVAGSSHATRSEADCGPDDLAEARLVIEGDERAAVPRMDTIPGADDLRD